MQVQSLEARRLVIKFTPRCDHGLCGTGNGRNFLVGRVARCLYHGTFSTALDESCDVISHPRPPEPFLDKWEGTIGPRVTSANRGIDWFDERNPMRCWYVSFVTRAAWQSWFSGSGLWNPIIQDPLDGTDYQDGLWMVRIYLRSIQVGQSIGLTVLLPWKIGDCEIKLSKEEGPSSLGFNRLASPRYLRLRWSVNTRN